VSLLFKPVQTYFAQGAPTEMYVVLLDNGRTDLLQKKEQRQGLYCIPYHNELASTPVHQIIGNQTYHSVYTGPLGSVISPHMFGMKAYQHLAYASTLHPQINVAYPVSLDIPRLLLLNRRDAQEEKKSTKSEKRYWAWFVKLMTDRKWLDFFGPKIKNFVLRYLLKDNWGTQKEFPKVAPKSFAKQWKEQHKNKDAVLPS